MTHTAIVNRPDCFGTTTVIVMENDDIIDFRAFTSWSTAHWFATQSAEKVIVR